MKIVHSVIIDYQTSSYLRDNTFSCPSGINCWTCYTFISSNNAMRQQIKLDV